MVPFFRAILLALLVGAVIWPVAPTGALAGDGEAESPGALLPRPDSIYRDRTEAGIPVSLDYYGPPSQPLVTFTFDEPARPTKPWPSIDEQGRILDHLLGRLLDEHRDLSSPFPISLGSGRGALMEALESKLLEPGANWNAKRGRPRYGEFAGVLKAELDEVLLSSPYAAAFAAHGYALKLKGIHGIDIHRVNDRGGALLPTDIDSLYIDAVRIPPKG
jgi:hypothetical protein